MADLTPARRNIQIEETQYRAGVTEGTFSRMGQSINFINERQYDTRSWVVNGPYSLFQTGVVGIDLFFAIPFNITIFDVVLYNKKGGDSGTTTVDLHRYTAPGVDAGTIFTTKPAISSAAVDFAYVGTLANGIGGGTGMTRPVLNVTDLNAGDALRFDIDTVMTNAYDLGLSLYYKPR